MMDCNLTDLNAQSGSSISRMFQALVSKEETIIGDISYGGFTFK